VDRNEAERALGIIRQVIQNTKEDLIAHNWGLIWIVHAFTNLVGIGFGTLIDRRELPVYWYLVPLAAVAAVDLAVVLLLVRRDRGVRSYVEWQLHGIWITFMVFSVAAAAVLHLADASPLLFGPLFAMTSGIGFALMGVVFYRRFLAFAFVFLATMLAAAVWPQAQWLLIGGAWWLAMFVPGVGFYREQRERQRHGDDARIL